MPSLGTKNVAELRQGDRGVPLSMRPAEAVGIGAIPSQVTDLLVRPDGSRGFTSAAAVLGVVDVRPLVTRPQGFAGCFPYG